MPMSCSLYSVRNPLANISSFSDRVSTSRSARGGFCACMQAYTWLEATLCRTSHRLYALGVFATQAWPVNWPIHYGSKTSILWLEIHILSSFVSIFVTIVAHSKPKIEAHLGWRNCLQLGRGIESWFLFLMELMGDQILTTGSSLKRHFTFCLLYLSKYILSNAVFGEYMLLIPHLADSKSSSDTFICSSTWRIVCWLRLSTHIFVL